MNYKHLSYILASTLLAFVVFIAPDAQAQTFSSNGVLQGDEQTGFNRCEEGALRSQQRALEIQQRINRVLTCNNQGQLYDSGSGACVNPGLSPDYRYTESDAGDTLTLINPDGTDGATVRIGGPTGASLTCVAEPATCEFDGVTYEHGEDVVAYRESVVLGGRSCNSSTNTETRTCNNGTMTGRFEHSSCNDTNDCTLDGVTIANGDTITAYLTDAPGIGQSCSSQTRTCNNGTLSGSYAYSQCGGDDAACTFNGRTIAHGASVTAYEVERVSASGTCNSETRVCTNGRLSGSFNYETCESDLPVTPEPPTRDCFFWVSGYVPGAASVGATDIYSNHVGRGAYPDATIPFSKANAGTFDSIAIGPKTRLVVYKGKNFKNGEFIDIHGPIYIGNQCLSSAFDRQWKSDPTPLVSSQIMRDGNFKVSSQQYVDMFPPNKRIERVMNGASAGCENNAYVAGAASQELLWGGGSIKVFCDRN